MNERQHQSLTEGPIFKTLFFSLPVLFGNVLQSLNGTVNAIWIGSYLGEAALTASTNCNSILFLLIGAMFGLAMATTILVGQSIGAKNLDQAKRVIGTSATFFALSSFAVAALGFYISPMLLRKMSTPPDAIPFAIAYLRIIFLGIPFLYMYSFLMMSLRGAGDSKTPFYFLFLSVGLDISLNPLLIFGWGPIPKMGIAGSATATLIAQAVSVLALIIYLYRSKNFLRIQRHEFHYFRPEATIVRSLITKGVPMGLQMIVVSGAMIAMISLVNPFGSRTSAAYGACFQLWSYIQMPAIAVGQAVSSMAAQNVGARKWGRLNRITLDGVGFNFLMAGILIALLAVFGEQALGLFLKDADAVALGKHINAIGVWSFALFGVNFVVSGVVRSTGAVIPPLVILFISMWLVRIPFANFLLPRWGPDAIWWSFPVSSVVSLVLSVAYYRFGNWRSAHMLAAPAASTQPVEG